MAPPSKHDEKRVASAAESARKQEIIAALCHRTNNRPRRTAVVWRVRRRVERQAPAFKNAFVVDPTIRAEQARHWRRREQALRVFFIREMSMRAWRKEPTDRVPCSTEDRLAAMMAQLTTTTTTSAAGGGDGVDQASTGVVPADQSGLGEMFKKMVVSSNSKE